MMVKYYPLHYLDVSKYEEGLRLSSWLRKHFHSVPERRWHGLIRKGQVRINGKRVRSHQRLREGGTIRIPPLFEEEKSSGGPSALLEGRHGGMISSLKISILAQTEKMLVLNKPMGLACQGGRGINVSVDLLLPFVVKGGGVFGSSFG